jgi:hypothetical protein
MKDEERSLCSLSIIDLCLLFNPLVSSNFGHCVLRPSLICVVWLLFWYLQTFGHCVLRPSSICVFWLSLWYLQTLAIVFFVLHWFVSSDNSFGIFKLLAIVFSVLHWFVSSDLTFWYLQTFSHCVLCQGGATCGAGTAYPSGTPEFLVGFVLLGL